MTAEIVVGTRLIEMVVVVDIVEGGIEGERGMVVIEGEMGMGGIGLRGVGRGGGQCQQYSSALWFGTSKSCTVQPQCLYLTIKRGGSGTYTQA